ncbi:hypothetical protein S83_049384, partial [Arachis hypogaea]
KLKWYQQLPDPPLVGWHQTLQYRLRPSRLRLLVGPTPTHSIFFPRGFLIWVQMKMRVTWISCETVN